jgi:hypothetical protein
MTLADYLELVRTLGLSLESESLSDTLKAAADSAGASISDLVAAIQSKPEEAARLILLSAEIRQGTGEEDASRLSGMLTEYIEQVSAKMAAETCGANDGQALKKVLAQLESQMFGQLANQNVPAPVMQDVKSRLSARFENIFAAANAQMPPRPQSNTPQSAPQRAQPAAPPSQIKLPPDALNTGNLLFMMNKEIRRYLRYNTPFSTVMISIVSIADDRQTRAPKAADAPELIPQLLDRIMPLLRDVDMIGTLDSNAMPELFAVLPMTEKEGAAIAGDKIIRQISGEDCAFSLAGQRVRVGARMSVTPAGAETKSLKDYMLLAKRNHKK